MTDEILIPDAIEPVVGWRAWRIHNGYLRSVHAHSNWPEREPYHAACNRRAYGLPRDPRSAGSEWFGAEHAAPSEHCSCGVYAAIEERFVVKLATTYSAYAIGRVALWGKVIEYDKGWRAEYAYPIEIQVLRGTNAGTREALEKRYGVVVGEWTLPVAR